MQHLRALLATARIANVPSVVSNVAFGAVLMQVSRQESCTNAYTASLAACLLYVAGNFLNDWYDVAWDRQHRPERAIPRALFRRSTYLITAIALLASSLGIGFAVNSSVGILLIVLALLVILYTIIHKKNRLGVWVMGSCRAMLYVVGMACMDSSFSHLHDLFSGRSGFTDACAMGCIFVFPALGMLCYIAGISLLAKAESLPQEQQRARLLPRLLVFSPILTHGAIVSCFPRETDIIVHVAFHALAVFGTWTYFAAVWPRPIGQRVSRLLMGIPLIDAILLSAIISLHGLSPSSLISHNPINYIPSLAFLLAGLLQRIAPAS
jgi:4-hydroxybenzoate polyprenyltransferase